MARLIVDGYNLLHAHPGYARLAARDLDSARARLVSDLAGLAEGNDRVVVVFDGGGNPASDGTPHHVGRLTVIFSRAGQSADELIEALAARSRDRAEETVVVTSDAATRHTVAGGCVSVLSSERFLEDVAQVVAERAEEGRPSYRRVTVDERIDPSVRDALAAWARGRPPSSGTNP